MYRNKRDVDKHVESLLSKLSAKEFKSRAYSVARLYFDVGDYSNCQKYVEQYLSHKDNNAAAYKLLGQALQKLGLKEEALEQYKASLDIDPAQTSTILDICELLADNEVTIEPGRAKYWCEKAEATFPRHPVTFRLREKVIALSNPDPEALIQLLHSELAIRPKDALLHARLLKHYLNTNQVKKAFEHACNIEFGGKAFLNNYGWYEILNDLLKHNSHNNQDWLYHLLLLTVKERICLLSITETPSGSSKSLIESNELLHDYDQAIGSVAKLGAAPGFGEFHNGLLQHHRGQVAFHASTFLLKKAKKDQMSWREATRLASPLMLVAWQTVPLDSKVNWLRNAPEKQSIAVNRWYSEGTYRCSQAGHYLHSNIQDKNHSFLDQVSQSYSGTHWRDKLYKSIFTSKSYLDTMKSSYLASNAFIPPVLRLPRKVEVESYDGDAQREYGSSLHHFVWMLLNYKKYADFRCTLFDMLSYNATNCGAETLNKLDIHAFLYCATLTAQQQLCRKDSYMTNEKPQTLPANITNLLCSLAQMKWWDCAYKFSQNELGTELTDIRATLSRGIEVVRCIDHHGLDPELLCTLGRIFSERAKMSTDLDEKGQLELRASLYYSSAIPLLEKLKSKIVVKFLDKRMFDYTHKELGNKEVNTLLEECKLYVAVNHLSEGEYDKVIEILSNLKSPQALYHLSQTYKKIALEENNLSRDSETKSKYAALLSKAKMFAYKALDRLRDSESNKNHPLYTDTQELIEDIETHINKIDSDLSAVVNDGEGKYSSDENVSGVIEHLPIRTNSHIYRNISSTPKAAHHANATNYRTAIDSQLLDNTRVDQQFLERIEHEIKNLQKRDSTIGDFMEQTKNWFDENRKLGNQIMSTIHSNMENTTDQFKLLKISIDQVKGQIDECRNECKDVGELKKQVAELKKEVSKLKIASSEQTIDDSDIYNLDEDYRTNESTSSFTTQLPFAPSQVIPSFNQRLVPPFPVPPNPYQLYNQSLYNLYNQYSQFAQPSVPGTQPIFDPTRTQVNYPGVYPTPDQMYLDVAHLVPPNLPTVPPVPGVSTLSTVPTMASVPTVAMPPPVTSVTMSKTTISVESKDTPRSLPVNVVITSSDPLPTCTTAPAPILSVTIPPKHIKGTPHNYQIPMPTTTDTKVISPPVFVFPAQNNKTVVTSSNLASEWNQSSIFKTTPVCSTSTFHSLLNPTLALSKNNRDTLDTSNVDGLFIGSSHNTSLNKSRTLSEKSNTSIENYDPCPDFKPIVPLPAEVKVTTGEEDEFVIFNSRAKLFRFVDKQWKERGLGEMKLLKHKITGKVRVLMRREQIHKICANHIITAEMEIKHMKNETKALFWVANDFADESVVLEKFCIRFKTADIAQDFYNVFEKARIESITSKTAPDVPKDENRFFSAQEINSSQPNTSPKDATLQDAAASPAKAVVGGFTFSSTPTFKSVSDDTNTEKPKEAVTSKVNVFSGLSFKTNASTPFSNLFSTIPSTNINNSMNTMNTEDTQESSTKLNTSDRVEEYEPNVEFKPVIPLPALVDQKTGEEDEIILFEHRAKLLRFDASAKEWKERGLGNIKLLLHKDNIQKVRLLMRREQIMKVCCNHGITRDMAFQKMPNLDKAVTWCAKDFSEGELVAETFCLRFKTIQLCDEFIEAVKSAQSKMKDESKAVKEEKNAAKQNNQTGFGEMFKPKAGSWHCDSCYTNNLENFLKCACCETPKPNSSITSTTVTDTNTVKPLVTAGWGDRFKPQPGSWECKDCLVRNEPNIEYCTACNSPRDPTKAKTSIKLTSDNAPKFNFGIPPKITSNYDTPASAVSSAGDTFKSSALTWEANSKTSTFDTASSGSQFRFGIPPAANEQKPTTGTTSIFDGTGAHKFSFGIPSNNLDTTSSPILFGDQKVQTQNNIFVTPKTTADSQPVNFSLKDNDKQSTPVKPALLPTPLPDSSSNTSFGFKEGSTFDFVFKPKLPTVGKSPVKTPHGQVDDDESDGNEYAVEDECYHPFTPVVPLPDKVEVITGEENETELYGQLAKLYRFLSGEWKERGKGIVKILKHKDTGKLRVIMRRDQVLKICMNHALTPEITYSVKDEKSWLFSVNDFSEGELNLEHFCLRFKSKEVALEFKDAIDNALQGKSDQVNMSDLMVNKKEIEDSDDVVFVSEIQATSEEKQKAKELMLPENFYTYKIKEPCQGCRGCNESKETIASITDPKSSTPSSDVKVPTSSNEPKPPMVSATLKESLSSANIVGTPVKTTTPLLQSPTNSIYGTPSNFEKTVDTSIFRTPLGSIGSNAKTPTSTQSSFGTNATNKENTFIQKPNIFSGFGEQNVLFETPQNKSASIFGSDNSETTVGKKNSLLAPPKLGSLNISSENQNQSSSNLGTVPPKFVFNDPKLANMGMSSNKSIFEFSNDNKKSDNQNSGVKSIFGGENKSDNLFTSVNQGSIFGPGALANNKPTTGTSIFGSSSRPVFGNTLFGTSDQASDFSAVVNSEHQKVEPVSSNNSGDKPEVINADEQPKNKETLFSVDNNLSFAALSSGGGPGFETITIQKKPDFQWEGTGQKLFVAKPNKDFGDKSKNESDEAGGAGAEDEYDPHYEPIVPLPDKIVVTTGEEDEEKMFGERCKLFRYDEKSREWKERGVGEMKVLYHPHRKTYRLLLRREQVHKAVLNMLLYTDLELLPMKNSDKAWTWAGRNFAENPAGEQETLAVRFKSVDLATAFHDKVFECVTKLQPSAAQAKTEEKEGENCFDNVSPLRLPKHLHESARADNAITAEVIQRTSVIAPRQEVGAETNNGDDTAASVTEVFKQVHFQESEEDHDDEEEDYDYDEYYNEEEEESAAFYSCEGEVIVRQDNSETTCSNAHIQVLFDQEYCSPRVLVTDAANGEILVDMLIYTDTEFQMSGNSCTWSGKDYISNDPVDKTVTVNFYDSETAMMFYDSCETSKATTYSSADPES